MNTAEKLLINMLFWAWLLFVTLVGTCVLWFFIVLAITIIRGCP